MKFLNIPPIQNKIDNLNIIAEKYKNEVDLIIDGGYGGIEASTIIDCSNEIPVIIREGKGKLII